MTQQHVEARPRGVPSSVGVADPKPVLKAYRYTAYSPSQTPVQGTIKAYNLEAAEANLVRAGYKPLVVRPVRQWLPLSHQAPGSKRVPMGS